MSQFYLFHILNLNSGQTIDGGLSARATPIYQTISYVFPDTDTASSIFNLKRGGDIHPDTLLNENEIFSLERKTFLILAKTKGTRAQIKYMLKHESPLRN